jgi:hypothetical protein
LGGVSVLALAFGADSSHAGRDMTASAYNSVTPGDVLTALGLTALAGASLLPLLLEQPPVGFIPVRDGLDRWIGDLSVAALLLLFIGWRYLVDVQLGEANAGRSLTFLAAAAAMTACHWLMIDRQPIAEMWQRELYLELLNHASGPPHQYRLLPYGFVRFLEWFTHDWLFACLLYRWFFNYWLLWSWHRFACLVHSPARAALTLLPFLVLYPMSIACYLGQLTDPLSHTLFVLGFIYLLENRPIALAYALALGILTKETAALLIACWLVCQSSNLSRGLLVTIALVLVAALTFAAARLPFGWRPGAKEMNEVGLMIQTNLGIGKPVATTGIPLFINYLHPLLFVVPFVPWIVRQWRTIDIRLRLLAVTLTPLLLMSNLCFGWLYESRNYVPLLPLLTTMALPLRKEGSVLAQGLP